MPLETRNRFTMTIWWSHFINLLMLETKEIIYVSISITDSLKNIAAYAITSTAGFFFVIAIMLQAFDLGLLSRLIQFQAKH